MTEAELLFTQILNCDKLSLYQNRNSPLGKEKLSFISSVLKRRIAGEPIQYILGKTEFMGLEFKVTPDVLIPRQETEILVETALKQISDLRSQISVVNILEIGTGSGNIAVSLAKHLPGAKICACDISAKALDIARANVRINRVDDSINFIQSDLFASYDLRPTAYDLIISNPPYVTAQEIDNLQPEIKYEPRIALDGGGDGLDFYRRIASQAPEYLKEDGLLILEMGFGQAGSIKNILKISENFEIIEVVRDYNGLDRVIVARKL
jgi:release factor glutamine methyltransferase